MDNIYLTDNERKDIIKVYKSLLYLTSECAEKDDIPRLREIIDRGIAENHYQRDKFGFNSLLHNLNTALLLCEKISPDRSMIIAIILWNLRQSEYLSDKEIQEQWGDDILRLIRGLIKVSSLYSKQAAAVESENFKKLLLTFAEDIRVIIIMIVERTALMRAINHHPNEKMVHDVAYEANYLYAPLAHRLGLYALKSELEDSH